MSLPASPSRDSPNVIRYAPLWMDSTFRPKATAEALLSAEREAGYLSPNDYDASVTFVTNWHRQYPLLGALAGVGLVYALRSPRLINSTRRAALAFALPFAGYSVGKLSYLNAHFKYLSTIENPYGFQRAIEHIQSQVGSPRGGIIMERPYQLSPEDMIPDEMVPQIILPNSDAQSPSPSVSTPRTKWDEIRAANNASAHNSSWDKLRQQHERKDLKTKATVEEIIWTDDSSDKVDVDKYAIGGTYDDSNRYGNPSNQARK